MAKTSETTIPGRLCFAKTGYVALRPQTSRARRRASCGVSPLSLRSGLPAPRRAEASLPENLTFCCVVSQHAAVVHGPRMQHVCPASAGLFFASLFVLTDALLCRAGGAKGARRAAFRLDAIPLRFPFP
jgi:hypothetical protein